MYFFSLIYLKQFVSFGELSKYAIWKYMHNAQKNVNALVIIGSTKMSTIMVIENGISSPINKLKIFKISSL